MCCLCDCLLYDWSLVVLCVCLFHLLPSLLYVDLLCVCYLVDCLLVVCVLVAAFGLCLLVHLFVALFVCTCVRAGPACPLHGVLFPVLPNHVDLGLCCASCCAFV